MNITNSYESEDAEISNSPYKKSNLYLRVAIIIAVSMNVQVAAIDLIESLGIPHTE